MKSLTATRRPSRHLDPEAVEDAYAAADLLAYRNRPQDVTSVGYRRCQRSRQSTTRR